MARRDRHNRPALRVAKLTRTVELLIEQVCSTSHIPIPGAPRKGRRPRHPHPLPRRTVLKWYERDSGVENYHAEHQTEYVSDCNKCYLREYLYFRRHPEERPPEGWAGGPVRRKRPWIDKGWEKDPRNHLPWQKKEE